MILRILVKLGGQLKVPKLAQCCLLLQETQRLSVVPWVGGANMASVLLNGEKWNYIGPKFTLTAKSYN